MGREKKTAEPLVKFNKLSFSRAVVIRGVTKYLTAGQLIEGASRDVYRLEVRELGDVSLGAFYAAHLLTENMAHGPEAAEITLAGSDHPPVRLTAAAINDANPEAVLPAQIRELHEKLGINSFSDIWLSETESQLATNLHTLGMGAAAVRACDERPQFAA